MRARVVVLLVQFLLAASNSEGKVVGKVCGCKVIVPLGVLVNVPPKMPSILQAAFSNSSAGGEVAVATGTCTRSRGTMGGSTTWRTRSGVASVRESVNH